MHECSMGGGGVKSLEGTCSFPLGEQEASMTALELPQFNGLPLNKLAFIVEAHKEPI